MRTSAPVHVIVHRPQKEEDRRGLAERVAAVHADAVCHRLQALDCSDEQKASLLRALIASLRQPNDSPRQT